MKAYSKRLEIAFWDFAIPLMSESRLVQAILPSTLGLLSKRASLLRGLRVLAWACAGLILGLLLGYLSARI